MNYLSLVAPIFLCFTAQAQTGSISGIVTDKDANGQPLPFVNVFVSGTNIATATDENGSYTLNVPSGTYQIEFSFLGYESEMHAITVAANQNSIVNVSLGSGGYTIQDVVVQSTSGSRERETALLLQQKNAVEIKQSIGAQELSRKGISTVEEGLTKITGISKVESRGLFIRGLEDRYNNLMINGLAVPSNSPFKKILPLDLFPTDVVGFMDVFKTFNPNIYGDFAGATINVNTSQPFKPATKINYGVGYTTNNNLTDFLIASDANDAEGFFGFGASKRKMPEAFGDAPAGQTSNDFKSGWNVDQIGAPLNTTFGVSHTGRIDIGKNGNGIRYLFATNFENEYLVRKGVDRIFSQGQGIYDNDLRRSQYKFRTSSSTLLGLNYKAERTHLFLNAMYLKSTENMIQDQIGYTRMAVQNPNEIIRLNQFEQSDYINAQLFGKHALTEDEKNSIEAGISFTKTFFTQPDRKFINGTVVNEAEIETTYGGNHLIRQYLDVDGNIFVSGFAEYKRRFGSPESDTKKSFSIGYNGYVNSIESTYRFVFGKPNGPYTVIVPLNDIDASLEADVASGLFNYREESTGDYNTEIFQNVHAGYANLFLVFGNKFEINAGIRAENTIRETRYRDVGASFDDPFKKLESSDLDILPSVNAKYISGDRTNFRLAISKTLTRPVLIETLPTPYINADGTAERGRSDLKNSENFNADLKFEFFPTGKELVAATIFGKYIANPIERTIEASGTGSGQTITYFNNKSATLYGAEFELLVQLNRLSGAFEDLSFGFNTTLMYSNAKVDKERPGYFDTFEERRLQGASQWLINSDLKYDFSFSDDWSNTVNAIYNVYGERIYAVGIANLDHIYEKPFHKLDLVWTSSFSQRWNLKLSIDNILNPRYQKELGPDSRIPIDEPSRTLEDYKRGTGYSINLSYTF